MTAGYTSASRGTELTYRAKHKKLHSRGIRLELCILIILTVLDIKPLYINTPRIAFRGKMHFVCRLGRVK